MSMINMKVNVAECRADVNSSSNDVICLLDDEQDAFQQYKEKSKQTLYYLLDIEPQNEYKFIETLEKYKLILEAQVDNISDKYIKEATTNDIIYITTNYKKIAALYVDNYLDVMEEILLILCNVIRNYFRDIENFITKIIKKESRRLKTLLQWSLLERFDRVMHLFLRIQIRTDVHEYKLLWADIFRYYLSRVFRYLKNDEIIGGYIIYQKLKDLTPKKEATRIDLCVYRTLGKTRNELKKIPILNEIIEKQETDPLYTVRDMCVQYYRYYKRKCNDIFRASYKHNLKPINMLNNSHSIFDNSPPFYSILSESSSCFEKKLAQRKTVFENNNMVSPDNTIIVLDDEDSDDDVLIISEPIKDRDEATIIKSPTPNDCSHEAVAFQAQTSESSMFMNEESTIIVNNEDAEPPDKPNEVLNIEHNQIVIEEAERQEKTSSMHDTILETGFNCYIDGNIEYSSCYSEINSTSIHHVDDERLDNISDVLINKINDKISDSCDGEEATMNDMKLPLPLKKRPVMENALSTTIITTPMDLMHSVSYPAERQMSIADLQNEQNIIDCELPKIRTLAARKYYPDDSHPACQSTYCNGSSQSIMDVYINGFNQCSDYPICFMISSMKTCLNHALTSNCHHHSKQNFLLAEQNTPIDASKAIFTQPPMIDKVRKSLTALIFASRHRQLRSYRTL